MVDVEFTPLLFTLMGNFRSDRWQRESRLVETAVQWASWLPSFSLFPHPLGLASLPWQRRRHVIRVTLGRLSASEAGRVTWNRFLSGRFRFRMAMKKQRKSAESDALIELGPPWPCLKCDDPDRASHLEIESEDDESDVVLTRPACKKEGVQSLRRLLLVLYSLSADAKDSSAS